MKRSFTRFAFFLFTFLICALTVQAQSVHDGFDPNANGAVHVVVMQPDGNILIGGGFTMVHGVARNHIARLKPDGTLDTTFNPGANAFVESIAMQPDGYILVGGQFSVIAEEPRNCIARLSPEGEADSFNPNPNRPCVVNDIAVQSDGRVLVGGTFTNINGQPRNRIARLEANGSLDTDFDPNANAVVKTIAVQSDGKILAGGAFTNINGQPRNRIARLEANGSLDTDFDPDANDVVNSIVVQADGKILIGGYFTSLSICAGPGGTRRHIARLNVNGSLDTYFNPDANGRINSIAVQADGKILVGGWFTRIGARDFRNYIARLDSITGRADSFNPSANFVVESIAVQSDGKVLVGGQFLGIGGRPRNHIGRLETNGSLDQTLNNSNSAGPFVFATAIQPDGKILIGGIFNFVLGVRRNNIARLNADGTLDTGFNPGANAAVHSIAVQSDGSLLVGGRFNIIDGELRNCIARLSPEGDADSFDPHPNSPCAVHAIAVQSDGKILVGGKFTTIGTRTRNRIARLDPGSGLADTFDPNPNGLVLSIAVQSNRKILIGGDFTTLSPNRGARVVRSHIARLEVDGSLDKMGFDPNANRAVESIAVQADGKILAGGLFTVIGGSRRGFIARLGTDGMLDTAFNPNAGCSPPIVCTVRSIVVQSDGRVLAGGPFNTIGDERRNYIARLGGKFGDADSFNPIINRTVHSIALKSDGKVFVAGEFFNIGSERRAGFARLSNDTAALSNIAVTPTTITWTREGSAPQLTRVTFEYSWDNGDHYHSVGEATPMLTPQASIYSLTGIRLPTGRNILIRARGYFRSGYLNGSESMVEQVQIAFLPLRAINLIQNPSFEEIPPCSTPTTLPCIGEGRVPSNWFPVPEDKTPDTYSDDDTYGLPPDHGGNFTGATARDGHRWIAGAQGRDFVIAEAFGQQLASPLIPGQQYTLTAYLRMAHREDLAHRGTYEIELRDTADPRIPFTAVALGLLTPPIDREEWQLSTLIFTATPEAATYRILVFRPRTSDGTLDTYPGIDNVALMVSSPVTASCNAGGRTLAFGRKR